MSPLESAVPHPLVSLKEMTNVFQLCRSDQWKKVHVLLIKKPWIALYPMTMDNNITTTVLHQAITSRGNIHHRALVMDNILASTPEAARLTNGYGSLPLHVIAQRNTKIRAQIKERIIYQLIAAYEEALTKEGGPGKRTPLHIIFTDYVSPELTQYMIEHGSRACFMKDRKGYLPAHVACSRHCSPEKLGMLLAANPAALNATTKDGHTLLSLATKTATKSHPNYALIDELNLLLSASRGSSVTPESDVLSDRPQDSSVDPSVQSCYPPTSIM
ncbi:hypothetical protein FisN_25Lh114 [Fistulifera solaris]|uniref:Uncharacterized protein n=1 Tax=Fistulifera solaris TaxID=1519565 RepID=A0A1Z5J7R8_FISSO|nr:hypothetical protein FisN_25Lh114 [Fistulifera solaris]|eukprot:GAX10037.1 hypothetical protein FisN_25Lh114 [Fistulifera solaris]